MNTESKISLVFRSESDPKWNEEINKVGGKFKSYNLLCDYFVNKLESFSEIPEDLICIYNGIQLNDLEQIIINMKQQANENLNKKEVMRQINNSLNKSQDEMKQVPYEIWSNLIDTYDYLAVSDFNTFMVEYRIVVENAVKQIKECIANYPTGMTDAEKCRRHDEEKQCQLDG